jgi:hypothetical protein
MIKVRRRQKEEKNMNIWMWIGVVFVAHLLMYYTLGTVSWFATSLLATAVWAIVLLGSAFIRNKRKQRI